MGFESKGTESGRLGLESSAPYNEGEIVIRGLWRSGSPLHRGWFGLGMFVEIGVFEDAELTSTAGGDLHIRGVTSTASFWGSSLADPEGTKEWYLITWSLGTMDALERENVSWRCYTA